MKTLKQYLLCKPKLHKRKLIRRIIGGRWFRTQLVTPTPSGYEVTYKWEQTYRPELVFVVEENDFGATLKFKKELN